MFAISSFAVHLFYRVCQASQLFESQPAALQHYWKNIGSAPGGDLIHLVIVLNSPNGSAFEDHAIEIATPNSASYRRHLLPEELEDWTRPSDVCTSAVDTWLTSNGLKGTLDRDVFRVVTSLAHANALLSTQYQTYANTYGQRVHRVQNYSLPDALHECIDFVTPTVHFPSVRREKHSSSFKVKRIPENESKFTRSQHPCGGLIGPTCTRFLYNISYIARENSDIEFGLRLSLGSVNNSDMRIYLERFNPAAARANATVQGIAYGRKRLSHFPSDEPNGDEQVSLGLAWPLNGVMYETPEYGYEWGPDGIPPHVGNPKQVHRQEDIYFNFLHQLSYNKSAPSTLSTSEAALEITIPSKYGHRLCRMFAQVGARGVSVFFPSGDDGVDIVEPFLHNGTFQFTNAWPTTCPFVTSVGYTRYINGTEVAATAQTAQRRIFQKLFGDESGGGFSTIFSRPKWQDPLVLNYVNQYVPNSYAKYGFNKRNRGFPDVSAIGSQIGVVVNGKTHGTGGSSFSSPLWGAILALLNDYEASKGRPRLGFINPFLYANPDLFHDITIGGRNNDPSPCYDNNNKKYPCNATKLEPLGYETTKGWDAVTGLGTPNFGKILEFLDSQDSYFKRHAALKGE